MSISVIIATKDRIEELHCCIESVLAQTCSAAELIVVDDSNIGGLAVVKLGELCKNKDVSFKYIKKTKNFGQGASYNLGAAQAESDIVLFLDDDVILFKDYIAQILSVYKKSKSEKLVGVSGVIVNETLPSRLEFWKDIFDRFFLLSAGRPGRISPWGFQSDFRKVTQEVYVDWLLTGCASFRRELFINNNFHQLTKGKAELVDIEFGWRISKSFSMVVTPSAKLCHYPSDTREGKYRNGVLQSYTRCWMFKKHGEKTILNYLCFIWANIGLLIRNLTTGFSNHKVGISKAVGNLIGFMNYAFDNCLHRVPD